MNGQEVAVESLSPLIIKETRRGTLVQDGKKVSWRTVDGNVTKYIQLGLKERAVETAIETYEAAVIDPLERARDFIQDITLGNLARIGAVISEAFYNALDLRKTETREVLPELYDYDLPAKRDGITTAEVTYPIDRFRSLMKRVREMLPGREIYEMTDERQPDGTYRKRIK